MNKIKRRIYFKYWELNIIAIEWKWLNAKKLEIVQKWTKIRKIISGLTIRAWRDIDKRIKGKRKRRKKKKRKRRKGIERRKKTKKRNRKKNKRIWINGTDVEIETSRSA